MLRTAALTGYARAFSTSSQFVRSGGSTSDVNRRALDKLRDLSDRVPHDEVLVELSKLNRELLPALRAHRELQTGKSPSDDALSLSLIQFLHHAPIVLRSFPSPHNFRGPHECEDRMFSLDELRTEAGETFEFLLSEPETRDKALAYAASIDPAVRGQFGIRLNAQQQREVGAMELHMESGFLDEQAALLLRDYTHPQTGTFNLLQAAKVLEEHTPGIGTRDLIESYEDQLRTVVWKMSFLPAARVSGPIYKGVVFNSQISALKVGDNLDFDRATSFTSDINQSYAVTKPHECHAELQATGVDAVDVSASHPAETVEQQETLMLPQTLTVSAISERSSRKGGCTIVYELALAGSPLQDASR